MEVPIFDGAPSTLAEDLERVDNYRTALEVNGIKPFSRGGEPPPSYDELLDERRRECQRELARLSKALRDARMKNRGIEMCAHARARDALDHKQLGGVLPELLRLHVTNRPSSDV